MGLDPEEFGVSREILENHDLLAIAYLDSRARPEVERSCHRADLQIPHARSRPSTKDSNFLESLDVRPPEVSLLCVGEDQKPSKRSNKEGPGGGAGAGRNSGEH